MAFLLPRFRGLYRSLLVKIEGPGAAETPFEIQSVNSKSALKVTVTGDNTMDGLLVTCPAAGSDLALAAQSTAANANLKLDAKGTGTITLAGTSTGAVSLARNVTVATGRTLNVVDADGLTVASAIVPQVIEASAHVGAAALQVDQSLFVANRAYQVTAVKFVHATAETTAATLYVQVVKDTGTAAPGAGTALLTNNTNNGFDGKAVANTVQSGTLTATVASLQLAAGDRLSLKFSAAATQLAGVTVTTTLKPI